MVVESKAVGRDDETQADAGRRDDELQQEWKEGHSRLGWVERMRVGSERLEKVRVRLVAEDERLSASVRLAGKAGDGRTVVVHDALLTRIQLVEASVVQRDGSIISLSVAVVILVAMRMMRLE